MITSYVVVTDTGTFQTAAITIAGWAFLDVDDNQALISKPVRDPSSVHANAWQVEVQPPDEVCVTGPRKDCFSAGITTNQWFHFAGTWDGQDKRLFVDGVEIGAVQSTIQVDDVDLVLGADYRMTAEGDIDTVVIPLTGALDDIRIYDRVLTPSEISELATRP